MMRELGVLLAAVALAAVLQGTAAQNGNDNGAYNYGTNNGGNNGNTNTNGLANGNGNGNYNGNGGANYQGYLNGISNIGAGNANGNGNTGLDNGIANGNYNANGANTGNGNGNNNVGLVNGIGNGNFNGKDVTNVGNNNGNGNLGVANGVGNGNFLDGTSNVGNNNGNGNLGSGNGNGNGNGLRGTAGTGSGNANGVPQFPPGFQSSGNGNTNGNGNGQPSGGGTGDPIMTGFDGRVFEFLGVPEAFYNIISERHHQVSTKLKLGELWDHNGTYMEGFGFQYRDHGVIMELDSQDELTVTVNGEQLIMTKGETELEMIPYVEGGELVIVWQKHREGLGNTIEITTELLQVIVWVTPAGTVDEGGKEQPAYLNFDVALLGPPAGSEMQGIVGETYNRMLAGEAVKDPNNPLYLEDDYQFHGKGSEADYQVGGYFGEHAYSLFGKDRKRVLIETDGDDAGALVAYPLRASGRPGARQLAAISVNLPAANLGNRRMLSSWVLTLDI
ncbi:hypothetical protein COCSUDRAFT_47405 [Coccomyxa subellipsoidea C-169]|uniref:PA14 domain-containing protein n=1 Tax=Coccomyxa subellipsoidea (strain C-169) TaxID=574566 RepID=I0YZ89_COCSC|nr:hypothetical protein COCSUDRAFT_47405 [Coccomyxa subellipsoidea C-169]EIE23708.1 hypothetical protein COCSUDRAFT_47405 [Coccomyxa subellipsoidea C-169]|eukprot:XP_005648252.1 hypothetical protein COCSUDRAFT_47405 [Coccomyxa subellipsoidea C-169]